MERKHLFEWEDLPDFPNLWRSLVTDFLQFVVTRFNLYKPVIPQLLKVLRESGAEQIVDFCSGSGGPWPVLAPELQTRTRGNIPILLTDRFPPPGRLQVRTDSGLPLAYFPKPVNAVTPSAGLSGLRTFFNAFHHFRPNEARKILENAVQQNQPVAIFELVNRRPISFLLIAMLPLAVWLLTPFIRPRTWQRIWWTYFFPVIPFVVWWDGLVSCLRVYSVKELQHLVNRIPGSHFHWKIGQCRRFRLIRITYLLGWPGQHSSLQGRPSDQNAQHRKSQVFQIK